MPRRAAFLIIGNEILSGRTQEKNLPVLTELLNARGVGLGEARVVRDEMDAIVAAVNALRRQYDYVFTSGGIGPTHDDITTDAIAAALSLPVLEHPDIIALLQAFYDAREMPFTSARRRMARVPEGGEAIASEYGGAPGYRIDNIYVCAGVPAIFTMMATAAVACLPKGPRRKSFGVCVFCGESEFADALAEVNDAYPSVEIGSYPHDDNGRFYCHVIFSGYNVFTAEDAMDALIRYLDDEQIPFEHL